MRVKKRKTGDQAYASKQRLMRNSLAPRIAVVFLGSMLILTMSARAQQTMAIDVTHIDLDLRLDMEKKQAEGVAELSLYLLKKTDTIFLDGCDLRINRVTMGEEALFFYYDPSKFDNALRIILPEQISPGRLLKIKVHYSTGFVNEIDPANLSGSNGKGLRFSRPSANDPRRPWEVYSVGEYTGNRYWFPCHDELADWRSTTMKITAPSKMTVVASGQLRNRVHNNDGTVSWTFHALSPYPNHLTSLVAGEYQPFVQRQGPLTMYSYGYNDEVAETKASVVQLPDMVRFFSKMLDHPFPDSSYVQVFVQDLPNWVGGMGMSTITENMIDDARTHADYFYLWDITEAEALAQQWFGRQTGAASWNDLWIFRGLSRYLSYCYAEEAIGSDELHTWLLPFDQGVYLNDWSNGIRRPMVMPNGMATEQTASDNVGYYRACAVMHMLREELGDETWWKAMRLLITTYPGKPISTADFIQVVHSAAGRPMDWFFNQWVYHTGHPVFEVTDFYNPQQGAVTVTIRQKQVPDSSRAFVAQDYFRGRMKIAIDDAAYTIHIDGTPEQSFRFESRQKPGIIHVDVGDVWIKELVYKKTWNDLLLQVSNGRDITSRQWALNEMNGLMATGKLSEQDRDRAIAVLTDLLDNSVYWRMKWNAIGTLQSLLPRDTSGALLIGPLLRGKLLHHIQHSQAWLKSRYISLLGATKDSAYAILYISALKDSSERVRAAAAVALGKTASASAFPALAALISSPSMKSQSVLHAMNGFMQLGDKRAAALAWQVLADSTLPRWRLPNGSIWDYRVVAVQTIRSLGGYDETFDLLYRRYIKAVEEDNQNDLFNLLLLMATLGDARAKSVFTELRQKFAHDQVRLSAVVQYEEQLLNHVK